MNRLADNCHSKTGYLLATIAFAAGLVACNNANFETKPPEDKGTGICIPGGGGGNATNGLSGSLYYLDSSQPQYQQVDQYISNGHKVPSTLFLNRVYAPTVNFTRGFIYENGQTLKRDDGSTLNYFFAFDLSSRLQLSGSNPSGNYQVAIISDDGVILSVDEGSGQSVLINGDGYNSSRFHCATRPIQLSAATKMAMRLKYFQGPPTHIALVMMWRPWPSDPSDPLCGKQGSDFGQDSNNFFFNTTVTPSAPTSNYQALLNRGWKPLETTNFVLPDGQTNPCTQQ